MYAVISVPSASLFVFCYKDKNNLKSLMLNLDLYLLVKVFILLLDITVVADYQRDM